MLPENGNQDEDTGDEDYGEGDLADGAGGHWLFTRISTRPFKNARCGNPGGLEKGGKGSEDGEIDKGSRLAVGELKSVP